MTPTPAASQTITAAHLKRDDATTAVDESAAAALLSSSIQSVLATGLPLSILSLAATNPAAASSWIASEVLVLQQTATTTTVPTPSWYRALPTDVKAYLLAAAESMVAAAEVAATATGTAAAGSSTSSSESETSTSTATDQKSYAIAAAYTMSGPAIAGVLLGSVGFVGACGALFAWRARLGWFNQLARRPSGEVEGYERAASRAALRREFKGSRLDVDVIVEEQQGQGGGGMEMGDMGGKGKDGRGVGGAEGEGEGDGRVPADRESVVTALPRYRPSILGNAAGWKAGWPSAWMSGR
ncbi:uncharacterized protein LTHEOB_119 [Lasiodiplodia theobromae]|uniref:uncharacterized protein n=1 Tax=Lasiodiplodia theobromae TaxID=45133 RepID=UPI0015C305FB|nr:uncharacterized protein LTHEOB_119 [Lasiodiplodia theobromae]KAF4543420.1 hypothetical protein LTHEOB_119 [Lasiodiplodia theobromae]